MLVIASSSNPSAVTTALIALGSAVVGALIAAVTQLMAEARRARHEAALDAQRADRERTERQAESERLARVVARLVAADLARVRAGLESEAKTNVAPTLGDIWLKPRITDADRRSLARHLSDVTWNRIVRAETMIVTLDALRAAASRVPERTRVGAMEAFRELRAEALRTLNEAISGLENEILWPVIERGAGQASATAASPKP